MLRRTGAQIIVALLERQGIALIPGIPGGANLPLYDALAAGRAIRHVLVRHEQSAGFIAQGMARVTGRPQVCLATSGPGATNLLTAIADAKLDSIPVIGITGQVPRAMIGSDAFQEVDTYGMSIPVTKHNFLVRSAAELLEVVPESFRIAASGRPGPVWIDVPKDVQTESADFADWPEPGRADPPPPADEAAVARAAAMINEAGRPLLYIGGGVVHAGAASLVLDLARKAAIPVATTLMGLGAIPTDDPQMLGMLGMHADRHTNLALEECDLLIALGVRFDDRATGRLAEFCPRARVVHVDIDAGEIGKLRAPDAAVHADLAETLRRLLPLVRVTPRTAWNARLSALRRRHPVRRPGLDDPRSPYGLIRLAAEAAGPDAIVSTDVGQHQMYAAQCCPLGAPRRWLTSGGLGTMGFGLPAAIGAALARPDATVLCFSGDGSLLMNVQELATAAELGVNVKIVLMNNNSLGLVRQQQALFYSDRIFASEYSHRVDFVTVAQGFGLRTCDLGKEADPARALARAVREPGPCLIHAPIDARDHVYPMVPPGAANKDMIGGEPHAGTYA